MASAALPMNALIDVQRYLRQKKATGAQVTPQNERAAWSGYFDTLADKSFRERQLNFEMDQARDRTDLLKKQQEAQEGASTFSGLGQLVQTGGTLAYGLRGTEIGSKIGLGAPATAQPTAAATPAGTTGAQTITATGAGAAPTTATGAMAPVEAANMLGAAGGMAPEATAVAAVPEATGILGAATPYLGPVGTGFAAGTIVPNLLGIKSEKGRMAAGAVSGAAAGALTGAYATSWTGPGAIVGGIIGAVAGGIGGKK